MTGTSKSRPGGRAARVPTNPPVSGEPRSRAGAVRTPRRLLVAAALAAIVGVACGGRQRPEPAPEPRTAAAGEDSVAVGYGTVTRRSVTGAVATLDEDDVSRMRAARIEDVLIGRVAGLDVQRTPQGRLQLRVRGASTVNGSTEPLLVIDGMPIAGGAASGALDALQPSDIARVSVLKDAEAAIYGSQGGNGVVLITTKRSKQRRPPPPE